MLNAHIIIGYIVNITSSTHSQYIIYVVILKPIVGLSESMNVFIYLMKKNQAQRFKTNIIFFVNSILRPRGSLWTCLTYGVIN